MPLFVLTETAAGYALLKAKDKKLLSRDDISEQTRSAERVCELLKLKKFEKFDSAAAALEESAALIEGKVTPMLSKLLDSIKEEKKASLAVADPRLGTAISKLPQLQIKPIADSSTDELYRAIREYLPSLVPGLEPDAIAAMSLGLSHSLSRHKLKFSPDKIDTMIIQAIALLDDIDKELNTYAMRVREWYGWHFPEMAKIINDNLAYAKVILKMGMRSNAAETDFSEVLPEEIETAIKAAAEISMGTEMTTEDLTSVRDLAEQVVDFTEYRQSLFSYLGSRMRAIAPNLTVLVGELVGARLIAQAGSLIKLAKSPASTIQILGAEKALFRALKTKHDTPKYGLLYHASLVGQATGKNKGKIARMLATKAALGLRVDSLADWGVEGEGTKREPSEEEKMALSVANRLKIERRLRQLEGKPLGPRGVAIGPAGQTSQPGKWEIKEARKYNRDADGLSKDAPAAVSTAEDAEVSEDSEDAMDIEAPPAPKLIEEIENGVDKEEDEDEDEDDSEDDSAVETETPSVPAQLARPSAKISNGTTSTESAKAKKSKHKETTVTTLTTTPVLSEVVSVVEAAAKGELTEEQQTALRAQQRAAKLAAKEAKAVAKEERRKAKLLRRAARDDKREEKKERKTKRSEEEADKARAAYAKQQETVQQEKEIVEKVDGKKRKRDGDEEKSEKKKKKKHSATVA